MSYTLKYFRHLENILVKNRNICRNIWLKTYDPDWLTTVPFCTIFWKYYSDWWVMFMVQPDSMVQWQHFRPECWEAWGPEFNPRPGQVGVRFLYRVGQPLKTFISYSLLSVDQLLGEITLKSYIFISYHHSCYLCCLHIQKALLLTCLSHP